jgi:deazaflavin-dependent oxidoreductase (nitroreductase family)
MSFDRRGGIKLVSMLHTFWYRMTDGVLGGTLLGSHILLLTTTGRRTGNKYTTPLLYLEDGERRIVIASNGGADHDPQWWSNLKSEPRATVQEGRHARTMHGEEATGEERARLWKNITSRYPVYTDYARRTTREIPVVVLSSHT